MRAWLVWPLGVLGVLLLVAVPARAQEPPLAGGGLDLSFRARALGVGVEPTPSGNLGLETMTAPTGAGTSRLPRAASGRDRGGVYIGVAVCDPVVGQRVYEVRADDPGTLPEANLRGTPGPSRLFIPGRP
jgi:hypothetical protein